MIYELEVDIYSARKYTDAFIRFLEDTFGEELSGLELELLNWLSDDEVKEFAERNYEVEFIEEV